jgi:AhpD family alkylhydroperoxidase
MSDRNQPITPKNDIPIEEQSIPVSTQSGCEGCPAHHAANLLKLGVNMDNWDYVLADRSSAAYRQLARQDRDPGRRWV